ncbi:hypothetical protein E2C01_030080 [Portunus trituberculatus]|uniref:Uncharacterized protein n=1 Tax=Portunus trituberculatus TaxID=210409 RepID=A0A5B7ET96_PORTR|nr:hypothetical protein [Portunus trituberculatus]
MHNLAFPSGSVFVTDTKKTKLGQTSALQQTTKHAFTLAKLNISRWLLKAALRPPERFQS